jgi:hypothetical protein
LKRRGVPSAFVIGRGGVSKLVWCRGWCWRSVESAVGAVDGEKGETLAISLRKQSGDGL